MLYLRVCILVSEMNASDVIDCRRVEGCENMSIQSLTVTALKSTHSTTNPLYILVCGRAYEGLLIYSLKTKDLIHRCCYRFIAKMNMKSKFM